MAKVIDELLIGVSVDADEREFNEVQSSFDQIKSSALSLGAVLAGGLSIDAILGKTNELAAEWDGLAKTTQAFEIDPILLQNLQHVSESLGGSKDDALGLLTNLRSVAKGLEYGNLGYLEELTKITGKDVISLFKGDEEDILKNLLNLFSEMNTSDRQAAFGEMGLGVGEMNLLQKSVEQYDALLERSEYLGNITKENTTRAENLQQAYTDAAKASDAAWQDFYGNLMEGSTTSLNYITNKLVEARKAQEGSEGFFQTYQTAGGEVAQSVASDLYSRFMDFAGPDDWRTNPMLSRDAMQQTTNSSSSRSVVNHNSITIQASGLTEKQMEGVVYKVINGAANQTEQDLKVNSQ